MAKKKVTYSLGIVLLAAVLGLLIGLMYGPKLTKNDNNVIYVDQSSQRLNALLRIVERNYVDKVDRDSLTTAAIQGLLSSLDPHSTYLPPVDYEKEAEMMIGHFDGIGVTLHYEGDTVYAANVREGSPAAQAGVHPGDRIMKVDTTVVSGSGMTADGTKIVDLIRGPRHSTVTLGIQRQGKEEMRYIDVRRDVILHYSIPAATMLDKTTGYVRIARFAETTGREFHIALAGLLQQGMTHLVLDMRGNLGGVLECAIDVADELLPKGDLIVYTEGAHSMRSNVYATRGGLFESGKLTIMIDEHSASASEVVSGAIQDNDRGTIVGRRSFGKGLVQQQFDLPDGAALLLTIARYYSPSGRCIQRPYDKGSDAYYMEYLNRVLSDYYAADSLLNTPADTTLAYHTKKGRTVYGGGGIQPDVVIPYLIDTNFIYMNQVIGRGVMEEVMFDQLFNHYDELHRKYPTVEAFVKNFQVDDATWKRILTTADRKGIARRPASIAKYGADMRGRYKAMMAQAMFDDNAFYKVYLPFDNELQQALNVGD